MRKLRYSKDVDILTIELSEKPIDYAEEEGRIIVHYGRDGEPVLFEVQEAKDFLLRALSSVVKEEEVLIP